MNHNMARFLVLLARRFHRVFPMLGWINAFRSGLLRSELKSCGVSVDIMMPSVIENPQLVILGDRVRIAPFLHVWGGGGVEIGSNVLIASHVVITSESHDPKSPLFIDSHVKAPVKIGDNVWIGAHAIILPGVTVGSGAVIGAGALVREDVPPRAVVGGVPAKVIRFIKPDEGGISNS